ncbi:MAG: FumA C-terminus/TtdB family hydratase beta subunit [Actinomycetota bacterium]
MNNHKDIQLSTPLTGEKIKSLKAGDMVFLTGEVFGARDMAHKRIAECIRKNKPLPVNLKDSTIFYVGPSPTPPGKTSGSVGPTTAARMDSLTEPLLKNGLRAMIGKGARSSQFKEMIKKYCAVYFVAVGGIAAYLSTRIKKIEQIAYHELGAEAIYSLQLENFPLFVAYDIYDGDIFEQALRME